MAMVLEAFASYVADMLKQAAEDEVGMLLGVAGDIDKRWASSSGTSTTYLLMPTGGTSPTRASRGGWRSSSAPCTTPPTSSTTASSRPWIGSARPLRHHVWRAGTRCSSACGIPSMPMTSAPESRHSTRSLMPSRSEVLPLASSTLVPMRTLLAEKQGYNKIMAVTIVGVGGTCKTTLAKKVFNDEVMNTMFDKAIWLSVNQNFDKVELLKTAITLAGGDHHGEKALALLRPALATALTGKRLLLVMDDVWSQAAWSDVLETTLVDAVAQGSRVLVTTRNEAVARRMKAVLPYHRIDKLDDEEAWLLFKEQVVSSEKDGHEIETLKDIGLQIIAKCGGLPLAVKVMGGLLCQKDRERRDWEIVLDDSLRSVSEMPEEINYAVYLSYEDLPPCVKQCFLYYSLLPKTGFFHKFDIIGMWISEGFLHGTSDDLEELGNKYHKELILRNLLESNILHLLTFFGDVDVCRRSSGEQARQLPGRVRELSSSSSSVPLLGCSLSMGKDGGSRGRICTDGE